jgi:signal transduction histidine kinase/ligand-binding sensor domain-containing protein/DNA-binding response OmpR family regulator
VARIFYSQFFILIFIFPQLLFAQSNIRFDHLSVEQGLSQNHVTRILKDSKGFMWFGTQNGLNRYDGKSFKVYKHHPDDSNSLSNNHVQTIYEDKNGNLWIGIFGGGVNKFEKTTEKFTHYRHDPVNNNSISSDFVLSIYEDKSGFLWIGTNNGGINKFDRKKNRWISYQNDPDDPNSLSHNTVRAFYEDESGILWIGTDGGGLNRFDKKTEKFTCYKQDDSKSPGHDFVLAIIADDDNLWLATGAGLHKFNRTTETLMHPKPYLNDFTIGGIQTLIKSSTEPDVIWISAFGIYKFDIKKENFTHYKHDPYDPTSLSSDITVSIYEDESGLLWIGTADKGLNKYNKANEKIHHYKNDPTNFNSLSAHFTFSIYEDKSGMLWIGTDGGGLNKFDREKGVFTHYKYRPDNLNSLSNNKVYSIVEEKPGILWIGTFDGLNRFDTKKNIFTRYKHNPNNPQSLSHNLVYPLHIDRAGNFWIGTIGGGLNKLILNDDEKIPHVFLHYKHIPNDPHSISNNGIMTIYEDDVGFLWVGTEDGLNKFDKRKEKFFRYQHDSNNPNSLSHIYISTIYQDRNGVLWIGTFGGGLNKLVPGDTEESPPSFIHYQEIDGLANDIIYGLLEDNHHNLWLSTKNGLSKFNPNEVDDKGVALPLAFKNYYVDDGFQDNEFTASYFKNSRGEMFFGGINGFNAFHPDSLKENLTIPAVVITGFKVFNEDYQLDTSIADINQIVLSHNENFFSLDFAVLDYAVPEKNNYAYKLDGLDNDWNYVENRNFAHYTNLSPGKYVFRVKGSNNNGIWNEEGTSIRIIITPPWWKTWWAYTVYILLIATTLYILRRYELHRQRLKHELALEQEQTEMKSRFFANISHEFRTPLTLILGPLEKLDSEIKNESHHKQIGIMRRNSRRLSRLINQLLDFSKLDSGRMKLQTSPCDIVSYIKGIMMSFQYLAEKNHIKYQFFSEKKYIELYMDRDKTEKIFYNLLSNAFKFTPPFGEISVKVRQLSEDGNSGIVEVSIKDNGKGILKERLDHIFDRFYQEDDSYTREHEGSGIGLALTKELVELHHGNIRVQSEVNRGSEFTVAFPLGKDHLQQDEIIEEEVFMSVSELVAEEIFSIRTDDISISNNEKFKGYKPIILIVEDNRDMCEYISGYLQPYYKIKLAFNGNEGIEKAKEIIPDLIISDIMMPKKDGYELCQNLKQDQITSHIPIILLTAKASAEHKLEGLELGADDYLIKPFDSKELLTRIKNLIEMRQKLREHFSRIGNMDSVEEALNPVDRRFLERTTEIVKENLGNEKFNVKLFCFLLGMSRTQLNRKMSALTGHSPNQFIRSMRLKEAARLIKEEMNSVSEAAYTSGFNNLSYFSKCFKEEFGKLPSEY